MFVETHKIISDHLMDLAKKDFNLDLKKRCFTWGNIKPDFCKDYIKAKHYFLESIESIAEKIIELSKIPEATFRFLENKINLHLGVIMHYIADFFCVPHSKRWLYFSGETIHHIRYEMKLNNTAKKYNEIKKINMPEPKIENRQTLIHYINEISEYYKRKECYKNDLIYAVNVCYAIIKYIFECIFGKCKKIFVISKEVMA